MSCSFVLAAARACSSFHWDISRGTRWCCSPSCSLGGRTNISSYRELLLRTSFSGKLLQDNRQTSISLHNLSTIGVYWTLFGHFSAAFHVLNCKWCKCIENANVFVKYSFSFEQKKISPAERVQFIIRNKDLTSKLLM